MEKISFTIFNKNKLQIKILKTKTKIVLRENEN